MSQSRPRPRGRTVPRGSRKPWWIVGALLCCAAGLLRGFWPEQAQAAASVAPLRGGGTLAAGPGFTGEYQFPNDLTYLRARSYDPTLGRFSQRDPLDTGLFSVADPVGAHRYAYANNAPTMYIDPSGHQSQAPSNPPSSPSSPSGNSGAGSIIEDALRNSGPLVRSLCRSLGGSIPVVGGLVQDMCKEPEQPDETKPSGDTNTQTNNGSDGTNVIVNGDNNTIEINIDRPEGPSAAPSTPNALPPECGRFADLSGTGVMCRKPGGGSTKTYDDGRKQDLTPNRNSGGLNVLPPQSSNPWEPGPNQCPIS